MLRVAGDRTAREHCGAGAERPACVTTILNGAISDKPKLAAIQAGRVSDLPSGTFSARVILTAVQA